MKEEVNIDEHDVKDLQQQLDMLHSSCDDEFQESRGTRFFSMGGYEGDVASEQYASCQEESENEESILEEPEIDLKVIAGRPSDAFNGPVLSESPKIGNLMRKSVAFTHDNVTRESSKITDLKVTADRQSDAVNGPTLSDSPKIGNAMKKSVTFNQDNVDVTRESTKISDQIRSSLRSSMIFGGPTESLAASLQRGLAIIDNHQRNSGLNKSLVALSFDHLATNTNDASTKTDYICSNCHERGSIYVQDSFKKWVVEKNESGNSDEVRMNFDLGFC